MYDSDVGSLSTPQKILELVQEQIPVLLLASGGPVRHEVPTYSSEKIVAHHAKIWLDSHCFWEASLRLYWHLEGLASDFCVVPQTPAVQGKAPCLGLLVLAELLP